MKIRKTLIVKTLLMHKICAKYLVVSRQGNIQQAGKKCKTRIYYITMSLPLKCGVEKQKNHLP